MHIDILNLLRTSHTCSALYVTYSTNLHTFFKCLCVCVKFLGFKKTLHLVEQVNPRFSTRRQQAQHDSGNAVVSVDPPFSFLCIKLSVLLRSFSQLSQALTAQM